MNKKILIGNTGIIIDPYNKSDSKYIENLTSIWNPIYYRREPFTGFNVDNKFITHHTNLNTLINYMPGYEIKYLKETKPKTVSNSYKIIIDEAERDKIKGRDQIQFDILNRMINEKSSRIYVNVQTGYGKTYMSIYYTCCLQQKVLVMCYLSNILGQWVESFCDKTNINPDSILTLHSTKKLKEILDGKRDVSNKDVFICTPKLLSMFIDNYGCNALSKLMDVLGIGIKIFDEAHRDVGNMVKIDACTNVRKTIYLSADFTQADPVKRNLYDRIFYKVPVLQADEALMQELKYINAVLIKYDSEPDNNDIVSIKNDTFDFSPYGYMQYQFRKGMIVDILTGVLDKILKNDQDHKILILVNLIEHANYLYDTLSENYPNIHVGKYHSEMDIKDKKHTKEDSQIIVSTYQSLGTGADIKNIRHVLSMALVNMVYDNQAAGRARPLEEEMECFYYMFLDVGFRQTHKTLEERLNYLKDFKIKKIYSLKL